jgi:hypothetical protein
VDRRHEDVVVDPEDRRFEGHARPADSLGPDEDLEQVVEPRRSVVLDVQCAQHEVALELRVQQSQMPEVLDARDVDVREVAPVVDDALRVRVGEPDAGQRRELERRLTIGYAAELQIHHAAC